LASLHFRLASIGVSLAVFPMRVPVPHRIADDPDRLPRIQ
jgi:hypothetical protein